MSGFWQPLLGTELRSYRELLVWQKSMDLSVNVFEMTRNFPTEEKFGITAQLRRSVTSISANIAEGQARRTTGEFVQSLAMARGSLAEVETFLLLSERLGHAPSPECKSLLAGCQEVNKMLNGLIKSVSQRKSQGSGL